MLIIYSSNFYCDISMHACNAWRSFLHSFSLYLWLSSADNLPFSNQLLWCLYFLQWVKEINADDWQKHAWGLIHNSMSPVCGCITGKSRSQTIKQQGFFSGVDTIWIEKKNVTGVSVWNTFLFLSKILHPSNDTDILNGPFGPCVTWLMMINCAKNNIFSLQ